MNPRALALALLLASPSAQAACPDPRPSDAASPFFYGDTPLASLGGERARIWYATEGKHAPLLASTREDGVPDHVALASQIAEDALAQYEAMGFAPPPGDDEPGCDGGDGRIDVYLMAFSAADGLASPTRCDEAGRRCSTFILVERSPQTRGYGSFDEGMRTILPHELFHAVQNGHDAAMARFWAEGSAQWAADALAPQLTDLERFLPSFLGEPRRSMDLPPGGVTASFLYGSALWPVFLAQRHGHRLVVEILEQQARGAGAVEAARQALLARGVGLDDELATFRAWNAATGGRDAGEGHAQAGAYPEVPWGEALAQDGSLGGVLAGLSAAYHPYRFEGERQVSFEADGERLRAEAIPLRDGRARLAERVALPARLAGEGVVVISGISEKKSDAVYTLEAAVAVETPEAPVSPGPPAPQPQAAGATEETYEPAGSGCSASAAQRGPRWAWLALALAMARRNRKGTRT